MADLVPLLADQATRDHALEVMLIAHVAIDRACLDGRELPPISPAGRRALRYVRALPEGVPLCANAAWIECWQLSPKRRAAVAQLVEDAERISVADLTFLSRETVLSCLGAIVIPENSKTDRTLELAEDAAA